jgi:hypothetical protein
LRGEEKHRMGKAGAIIGLIAGVFGVELSRKRQART